MPKIPRAPNVPLYNAQKTLGTKRDLMTGHVAGQKRVEERDPTAALRGMDQLGKALVQAGIHMKRVDDSRHINAASTSLAQQLEDLREERNRDGNPDNEQEYDNKAQEIYDDISGKLPGHLQAQFEGRGKNSVLATQVNMKHTSWNFKKEASKQTVDEAFAQALRDYSSGNPELQANAQKDFLNALQLARNDGTYTETMVRGMQQKWIEKAPLAQVDGEIARIQDEDDLNEVVARLKDNTYGILDDKDLESRRTEAVAQHKKVKALRDYQINLKRQDAAMAVNKELEQNPLAYTAPQLKDMIEAGDLDSVLGNLIISGMRKSHLNGRNVEEVITEWHSDIFQKKRSKFFGKNGPKRMNDKDKFDYLAEWYREGQRMVNNGVMTRPEFVSYTQTLYPFMMQYMHTYHIGQAVSDVLDYYEKEYKRKNPFEKFMRNINRLGVFDYQGQQFGILKEDIETITKRIWDTAFYHVRQWNMTDGKAELHFSGDNVDAKASKSSFEIFPTSHNPDDYPFGADNGSIKKK